MSVGDQIHATWGPDAGTHVTVDNQRALDRDVRLLWRSVQALSETSAPEPARSVVHTARALPALLEHQGEVRLVYDAGLGTLFSQTFKVLNHPQHDRVVDALLLRIAAVRRVCAGYPDTAAVLAAEAGQILRAHPVRDYVEDAESAFEGWLAVTMQEQFAVAHELLHYLEVADPVAFARLRAQLRERLYVARDALLAGSVLAATHDVGLDRPMTYGRHRAGVEPDGWWYAPRFEQPPQPAAAPVHAVLLAVVEQAERDGRLLTELTCDLIAAIACANFAQRGNGWSALQSAAASVLALATLGLVVEMDGRSRRTGPAPDSKQFGEWELRLTALRVLLADAVSTGVPDSAAAPTTAEAADAMRRATGLYDAILRTRYARLDTWPQAAAALPGTSNTGLLLAAGFLNLRADPRGQHQRDQEWWTH